ncbi:MAG: methyltransferase [Bradymonadia bacterium]
MNPRPLIELATAYWGSATLIAASELGLFTALAEGPATSNEVAAQLGLDPIATDALLAGCVSLELVRKNGDSFTNEPLADTFLVEGKPGYLGPALSYNGDVYPLWGNLARVIQEGCPPRSPDAYLGADDHKTRNFVYGMHHRALGVGRAVAQHLDFSGCRHLADIGGGPGTYSALLSSQYPELRATVLDLPAVVEIADVIVESMGASERVNCQPFDYYKDTLKIDYDSALISGVLHREQPEGAAALIAKAAAGLAPGGVIYISDVMLNDARTGPLFGTMFALNMRVLAHDGRCHSVAEQTEWLAAVDCEVTAVHQLPPPINYTIIRAEKRS